MPPLRLLLLLIAAALAAVAWAAAPAATPAGTRIRNQAAVDHAGERILSNEVETVVRAVCLPDLGPDGSVAAPGQFATTAPAGRVYLPYTLVNAGNVAATFALGWALDAASAWAPADVAIYHDLDGNGRRDSGDPRVTALTLPYGGSARLLLEASAPADARGDVWPTPLASCPGGATDEDNYARVRAADGPALQLAKSVADARLAPGDATAFELRLQNVGPAPAGAPVVLTDRLDGAALAGLVYLAGSAVASQGELEYFDGADWSATPPADPTAVRGLRVTVDDLEPGEALRLAFAMRAEPDALPGPRRNLARADGPGGPAQVAADVEVVAATRHHLGPRGNPRALTSGEGGPDDRQSVEFLVFGQRFCFEHTLENAGNIVDVYRLELSEAPAGVRVTLDGREGVPLANPLELAPGERRDFLLCLLPGAVVDAFEIAIDAVSRVTGARDRTVAAVGRIEPGEALRLRKEADVEGVLEPGQLLTYTLIVENANPFDLTDVLVRDPLRPLLRQGSKPVPEGFETAFVAASDGGVWSPAERAVSWRVARLPSGATLRRTLQVRLPEDAPAGAVFTLRNGFTLQAQELPAPLVSNEVRHAFPEIELRIEKRVTPDRARIGDALAYELEIRNPNELPMALVVDDLPPARTAYLPGSAELTLGETVRRIEPRIDADGLHWDLRDLPEFELGAAGGPRERLLVRYRLVLQPGAAGELRNTARASGSYSTDVAAANAVASNVAVAAVEVEDAVFDEPDALLLGRVYLDRDADGRYSAAVDAPLPGARLVLDNGVQTLSDGEGRYAFRGLRPGVRSLMLDPASAPFAPLPHPEALGGGYRHRVPLQGATVSDFPLEAPAGAASASRSTVLVLGPLRLEKRQLPLPEGVRVVLTLESADALPGLRVTDPVPGAAPRVFEFDAFVGVTTLTYDLDGAPALTDPEVGWSYP